MPDAREQVRDEDGEDVVRGHGAEEAERDPKHGRVVAHHDDRVENVLERADVLARDDVRPREHHGGHHERAPEPFEPDDHERVRAVVAAHDLFLKNVLTALHAARDEDQQHAEPGARAAGRRARRARRARRGVRGRVGPAEDRRGRHEQHRRGEHADAGPAVRGHLLLEHVALEQRDDDDHGAADELVHRHRRVQQAALGQRRPAHVEHRGDDEQEEQALGDAEPAFGAEGGLERRDVVAAGASAVLAAAVARQRLVAAARGAGFHRGVGGRDALVVAGAQGREPRAQLAALEQAPQEEDGQREKHREEHDLGRNHNKAPARRQIHVGVK